MTTGYVATAGDLDALFKARTSAAIANTGYKSNGGVDLAQRFEPRGSTTARANTGFRSGGTDLSQLFMDIAAAANVVNVNNLSVTAFNTGSVGIASYQLTNAGSILATLGTNTPQVVAGGWIQPQTNMGLYSARMTINSGSSTSGTFGSWLNLATTRVWTLNGGSGGVDATWTVEIRLDSSGVVQDSAVLTVHAERDV